MDAERVREMRVRYELHPVTLTRLAEEYGLSTEEIWRLLTDGMEGDDGWNRH